MICFLITKHIKACKHIVSTSVEIVSAYISNNPSFVSHFIFDCSLILFLILILNTIKVIINKLKCKYAERVLAVHKSLT